MHQARARPYLRPHGTAFPAARGRGRPHCFAARHRAKDGTAAATIANSTGVITVSTELNVDNLNLSGNTISSTNTNGNIVLDPNGTGVVDVPAPITNVDYLQFDTAATVTDATGRLYYANADQFQTLTFQMNGSVIQHIGESQFYRVKCSGSITKGQVVMFAGTLGSSGGLIGAAATGLTPLQADRILGLAAESGVNNDWITICFIFINSRIIKFIGFLCMECSHSSIIIPFRYISIICFIK